ncbi:oligosaccharyl transferase, archaeosortase A system-associated [Halosimplex pelagicum]|uniref:dolichyl-phosphooligosaccharide-protein glycotransferase n=1 Tax=Halosimplex pelagicum TaxID=869886 RepID=A0A7D5PB30_9EURY|nr:oligosaccharyl transferase, archaeosortase A system-associated [Halosimplex pelagicum]QLH82145.1 oligosaccharyl transferase, archaeosortase A system-associated [Halosimplex pelagicum]
MELNTSNVPSLHDTYHTIVNASWESVAHAIVMVGLLGFIFANRVRNYTNVIRADGTVVFQSADGWYHQRATVYTVENYPETLNFDPYTGFDAGNQVGQFGTLFDQILATVALVIGGGNPSISTINSVLAFTPPILAVAAGISVYYLSKAITNRWGGLTAVGLLALTPGLFLSHSMVGFIDHHIAETVLVSISLLCCVRFTKAATEIGLGLTQFKTSALNSPITWSLFAGIANAVYLVIWPPGLLYIAILSVFLAAAIITEYLKENDPVPLSVAGAAMMLTSGIATLPFAPTASLSVTTLSFIQVLMPISVGIGCLFLGYTAQKFGTCPIRKVGYLLALGAGSCSVLAILALVKPSIIDFFIQNSSRVFWFIGHERGTQIAEADTLSNPFRFGFITYGFALIAAIVGWVLMVGEVFYNESGTPARLLFVIFTLFMTSATITQPRFDYYLVIAVAVLTAYSIYSLHQYSQKLLVSRDITTPELKSKIAATGVAILVLIPLVLSGAPIVAADSYTSPSSHNGWTQSFDWIESETPEFGSYGVESSNQLDYNGEFPAVDDYTYQEGQYGILSRWGIGHRLTVETRRVPVSNPHQQHSTVAADVLLAPSEDTAIDILDSKLGEGSGVRYVVLGQPWGSGDLRSFTSPAASEGEYDIQPDQLGITLQDANTGSFVRTLQTERSYESLRTRLYQFHGSATTQSSFVIHGKGDLSSRDTVTSDNIDIEEYENAIAASNPSSGNSALHGGLYGESPQQIDALQHFRLVHASEGTVAEHPESIAAEHSEVKSGETSAVKTFERVPGATIQGEAPENTTVKASVELRITTTGKTFTYTQYATANENGTFDLVVPYATTGYSQYTTEDGYTNTSIRAEGPYRITTVSDPTSDVVRIGIPEGAVLGEETISTTVQVEGS